MNIIQIDNWRDYRRDGEQFLHTAVAAHQKQKRAFSPDTIYNLTCMAIEKTIMAFLMKHGDLAENHTMGDLQRALAKHMGPDKNIEEKLSYLDTFQEICDLETYNVRIPSKEDITRILAIGSEIHDLLSPFLAEPDKAKPATS